MSPGENSISRRTVLQAAAAVPAVAGEQADAKLIALGRDLDRTIAEVRVLLARLGPMSPHDSEYEAIDGALDDARERVNVAAEEIAGIPAWTDAGRAAKARAAHWVMFAAGPAPNEWQDQLVSEVLRAVAQGA